jgi:hypothetical protein
VVGFDLERQKTRRAPRRDDESQPPGQRRASDIGEFDQVMKGKNRIVNKKLIASFVALLLLAVATAPASFAQRRRGTTAPAAANPAALSPLSALPASDAVMLIDIKRLLNDVAPRVLAGDPEHLAKFNAHLDQIKTQYGLDVRSFERLAVGFRFQSPRPGVTTTNIVAVTRGTFNSGALLAAGRIAAKGKYQEEKFRNETIYIFDLTEPGKAAPDIMGMRVPKLAIAALDANTLAFGELEGVRATISSSKDRRRVNTELIQMAMRNPNAFVSFGANVPPSLTQGKDFGNDEINKNLTAVRQAYGALGLTDGGYDLKAIARTERADQAKSLGDTLAALKQFGGVFISQLPPDKGKLAQAALDSLTITTEGNETQLKLELAQAIINQLMQSLQKKG